MYTWCCSLTYITISLFMDSSVRHRALTLHQAGLSTKSISLQLGTLQRNVQRWIKRDRDGKSLEDDPRSGRPAKRPRVEKAIKTALKSKEHGSVRRAASKVSQDKEDVSKSTAHRIGQDTLDHRAVSTKPLLKEKQREARLAFADRHLRQPQAFWDQVVFTDEKVFTLFKGPRKMWVDKGKKPSPNKSVKHPPKIMVHGAMCGLGQVSLVRVDGTLDSVQLHSILSQDVVPAARQLLGDDWVFQQDSTEHGVHGAKFVREWLDENTPKYLRPWPAQSPDLNPIEHVWAKLSREVYRRAPTSTDELWEVVQEEWEKLDIVFFQNLTHSMKRRLTAVRAANGGVTKY